MKLFANGEILGAMLADKIGEGLKSKGKAFITEDLNVDLGNDIDLKVVENTDAAVNLVLPYYDGMQTKAEPVALEGVTGGAGAAMWFSNFLFGFAPFGLAISAALNAGDSQVTETNPEPAPKYTPYTRGDIFPF